MRLLHEPVQTTGPIEQRVLRVEMEMNELRMRRHASNLRVPRDFPQAQSAEFHFLSLCRQASLCEPSQQLGFRRFFESSALSRSRLCYSKKKLAPQPQTLYATLNGTYCESNHSIFAIGVGGARNRNRRARKFFADGLDQRGRERHPYRAVGKHVGGPHPSQWGADGTGSFAFGVDGEDFGPVQGHGQFDQLPNWTAAGRTRFGRARNGWRRVAHFHFPNGGGLEDCSLPFRSEQPELSDEQIGLV